MLVEQTMRTLFGGVSRQPNSVRRENQVEDCINAMNSIVTGGFEKRPGTKLLSKLMTLENRLLQSEDWSAPGTWPRVDAPVVTVVDPVVAQHPFGNIVYSVEDNSPVNREGVEQAVAVDPAASEFMFSIDICWDAASLTNVMRLTVITSYPGPAPDTTATVDINTITGAIVAEGGPDLLFTWVDPIAGGWFRAVLWTQKPVTGNQVTVQIFPCEDPGDEGIVRVSRAQLEEVTDIDQERASPYAYTEDTPVPRLPMPGEAGHEELKMHGINRDAQEQYVLLLGNNRCLVYDGISGLSKQVIIGDSTMYFAKDMATAAVNTQTIHEIWFDPAETSIDFTFNWREVGPGAAEIQVYRSDDRLTWVSIRTQALAIGSGTANATVAITPGTRFIRCMITVDAADGHVSVRGAFRSTSLLNQGDPNPEDFSTVSVADHTFICNKNIVPEMGRVGNHEGFTTIGGTYQRWTDLPGAAVGNLDHLYRIAGDDADKFSGYWVVTREEGGRYFRNETSSPHSVNDVDHATWPWELRKTPEGRFTLSAAEWEGRTAGDTESNPVPNFVDKHISSIFFYRGRLGVLSDEGVTLSRIDNTYAFFAEKAIEVLDSDPIDRQAQTERVAILSFATPFRKMLVVTSPTIQFEMTAFETLTPESAVLDPSTAYTASSFCQPVTMGDTMYFAVERPNSIGLMEYYYDEESLTNTAVDITSHVPNYFVSSSYALAAETVTGTLFVLPTFSDRIYAYKTFWDNQDKVLSAWSEYRFDETSFIQGITTFGEYLVTVLEEEDSANPGSYKMFLVQMPVATEGVPTGMPYAPHLDLRTIRDDGVYNPGTDLTTWFLPFETSDETRVIKAASTDNPGEILPIESIGPHAVSVVGDYSGEEMYIGRNYEMRVKLSTIFLREKDGVSIITGKLMLHKIKVAHRNTAYYKIVTELMYRPPYETQYTAYTTDSGLTLLDAFPLQEDHFFEAPIRGKNTEASLSIVNDAPLPCTIVSATWRGFYSNIARNR